MKILICGAGGVGGYFGARLAAGGEEVAFLGRGKHLEAMRRSGLVVKSAEKEFRIFPVSAIGDVGEAGIVDVVLICVKTYDTALLAPALTTVVSPRTLVISLQNGIDSEAAIRKYLASGEIAGGVAVISARITAPGEITESGGIQRLVIGRADGSRDSRYDEFVERCVRAGISATVSNNILAELWKKFVFITSMGSFTASSGLTQSEILDSREALAVVMTALREGHTVAKASGADLGPVDENKSVETWRRFNPSTRSSMYYDLAGHRPLEIESLNGTMIRLAERHGIDVPTHRFIYASLVPHHRKNLIRPPQSPR